MKAFFSIAMAFAFSSLAGAAEVTVDMHRIDATGIGLSVGKISATESQDGVVFSPDLEGLPPGSHGFHVHEHPDCGAKDKEGKVGAGLAAGGHYDPAKTGKHEGPSGNGHLGDLPMLAVAPDGTAKSAVTAPRLKLADLVGRSLMIHAEADNYADKHGGARIACGAVGH